MAAPRPSSKSCVFNVAEHRKYRSHVPGALTFWKVTGNLTQVRGVAVGLVDTLCFWCTKSGKVHTVCTPQVSDVCGCVYVCVCVCMHACMYVYLFFLLCSCKENLMSEVVKLFPVGMMKLCLACCLVKSMWKMGKGERDGGIICFLVSVIPPFSSD